MTGPQIIAQVKALGWPKGSYIVFGSCPMALVGLREAQDIDFLVDEQLFAKLKGQGWQSFYKSANDIPLVKDDFEAHANWNFSSYQPTLSQLLATATVAEGVPFAALNEVRKWKASSARPKDLADIKLIDTFLNDAAHKTH
jgi:hypothetical protein